MTSPWLQTATSALSAGDRRRALALLRAYLLRHPADEEGWYWLDQASERPEYEIALLQSLLAVDQYRLRKSHAHGNRAAVVSHIEPIAPVQHIKPANAPPAPRLAVLARRALNALWYGAGSVVLLVLLAAVFPMFLGYRSLTIISGSMEPSIHTGSIVVAEPVAATTLALGDVIIYSPSATAQTPTVHRIVTISDTDGKHYYTTRGDANSSDDAEVQLPATTWRVAYSLPLVGYVISFATSKPGVILFIVTPALVLVVLAFREWLGKRKRTPLVEVSHGALRA